jgi:hypothetical protein
MKIRKTFPICYLVEVEVTVLPNALGRSLGEDRALSMEHQVVIVL